MRKDNANPGMKKLANDKGILPEGEGNIRKSPNMIGFFLILWIASLIVYGPRLLQVIFNSRTAVEAIILSVFSIFQFFFWMLAAYFLAVVIFSFISKPVDSSNKENSEDNWLDVALLYTTFNDFCADAAVSCLKQDYPNFHMFLLDDSTKKDIRSKVDAFHTAHPDKTTIIRRPLRQGYKSGALNNAINGVAAKYPFFAVADADEELPTNFLKVTMKHMSDFNIAFVQANHAPNPKQKEIFARDIGPTILPFWDIHCRARNRYGFVTYVGHGAVVRRSVWEKVGGFPEVITEDLAFSAVLAEKGMRGLFLDNLVCYEDFPITYSAFRRQHERYVVGTTQVMRKLLGRILRSPRISLTEKIDFVLWSLPLYVPALCLIFVALCSLSINGVFGDWSISTISIFDHQINLPVIRIIDERFASLWSWDFQLLSIFAAFSPAFACIALGLKRKLNPIRLLFLSTLPYLSLMILSWKGILKYLFTGNTSWPTTGEIFKEEAYGTKSSGQNNNSTCFGNVCTQRFWEISIGGILAIASLISFNIAFFAVSSSLLVGVYLEVYGWNKRFAYFASISCFTLILLHMIINLTSLAYFPGLVPMVFSVHF